jgi:FAD-linked oxidoreductase
MTSSPEWSNWTGDRRCTPRERVTVADEEGVVAAVRRARERGLTLRVAGAGHSFSDLVPTDGILVSLAGLDRVVEADPATGLARVQAGITLRALGPALAAHGLALENQGDIDAQTLAGALATGTHGTGATFRNLSANVVGMRLVDGRGEVVDVDSGDELRAARVSLGALGVVVEVTVRCVPLYGLDRVDEPQPIAETLAQLDELVAAHDHFELFAFPHTDTTMVRRTERVGPDVAPTPAWRAKLQEEVLENAVLGASCRIGRRFPRAVPSLNRALMKAASRNERRDLAYRVYASRRAVRFTEMEYALPREVGREAVERALATVAERRIPTGFPFEVRFVAGDDALLSPAHGRDTCYVAVHQYRGMPFEQFFAAVEEIFASYGGRPHWGKRHTQTAKTLAPRYPEWASFAAVRDRFDPDRVFTSEGVARVLGP